MEANSTAAGVVGLVASVTKLATALNDVRQRYNYDAFHITGVTSSLWTIKAALEAIGGWRTSSRDASQRSQQLDLNLEASLQSCALLVAVVERQLAETNLTQPACWDKDRFVGLDTVYKDFAPNLDAQVRALQLLLTIFQCRIISEQRARLENEQTRSVFRQILDSTTSLRLEDQDLQDAASILSENPSVNLTVDAILLNTPLYQKVYKKRFPKYAPPPVTARPARKALGHAKSNTASSASKRSSERPLDPFLTENLGLPFLGIPFQGESTSSILEEEYSSEEEDERGEGDEKEHNELPARHVPKGSSESSKGPVNTRKAITTDFTREQDFTVISEESGDIKPPPVEPSSLVVGSQVNDEQLALDSFTNLAETSHRPHSVTTALLEQKLPPAQDHLPISATDSFVHRASSKLSMKEELAPKTQYSPDTVEQHKEPVALAARQEAEHSLSKAPNRHTKASEGDLPAPQSSDLLSSRMEEPLQAPIVQVTAEPFPGAPDSARCYATGTSASESSHGNLIDKQVQKHPQGKKSIGDEGLGNFHINFGPEPSLAITDLQFEPSNNQVDLTDIQTPNSTAGNQDRGNILPGEGPSDPQISLLHPPLRAPLPDSDTLLEPTSPSRSPPSLPDTIPKSASPIRAPPPIPDIVLEFLTPPKGTGSVDRPDHTLDNKAYNNTDVVLRPKEILSIDPDDPTTFLGSGIWERTTVSTNLLVQNPATSLGTGSPIPILQEDPSFVQQNLSNHNRSRSKGSLQSAKDSLAESIPADQHTYLPEPSANTSITRRFSKLSSIARGSISALSKYSERSSTTYAAVASGDVQLLEQLLTDTPRLVNSTTSQQVSSGAFQPRTPLMSAVLGGQLECIEILRKHHADISVVDKQGKTALHLAVEIGRHDAVTSLLRFATASVAGKPRSRAVNFINAFDGNGMTALHIAAQDGNYDTLNALITAGANIELANDVGRHPLHLAVAGKNAIIIGALLSNGANINAHDAVGQTCLMLAVRNSDTFTMTNLMAAGASITPRDNNGETVMHHAARVGHLQAIEILPIQASDLEPMNKQGETPLHIACSQNRKLIVGALLERGVQVNAWTAPPSSRQRIFSKSASNVKTLSLPATPLHLACFHGHYDSVSILMKHGAWLHATLEDTRTPLMLAVQSQNPHLVLLLLENGAKVNAATSKECFTALHFACLYGDLEITKMLISHGANTFALTNHNPPETPASYAYKFILPTSGRKDITGKWAAADYTAATSTSLRRAKMGLEPQQALPGAEIQSHSAMPGEGILFQETGLLDPTGSLTGRGRFSSRLQPISASHSRSSTASGVTSGARTSFGGGV